MLECVLLAQQIQNKYIKQLTSKVDLLTTHNKMLETQITQQATSSITLPSRLPSKPEQNPREQCNVIVLRSGTQLEGPRDSKCGRSVPVRPFQNGIELHRTEKIQNLGVRSVSQEFGRDDRLGTGNGRITRPKK